MSVKLLTKHHLEFVSLKGGCTGSSESTLVKMPHCWKSHVTAHLYMTAQANPVSSVIKMLDLYFCSLKAIVCKWVQTFPHKYLHLHKGSDKLTLYCNHFEIHQFINCVLCAQKNYPIETFFLNTHSLSFGREL